MLFDPPPLAHAEARAHAEALLIFSDGDSISLSPPHTGGEFDFFCLSSCVDKGAGIGQQPAILHLCFYGTSDLQHLSYFQPVWAWGGGCICILKTVLCFHLQGCATNHPANYPQVSVAGVV